MCESDSFVWMAYGKMEFIVSTWKQQLTVWFNKQPRKNSSLSTINLAKCEKRLNYCLRLRVFCFFFNSLTFDQNWLSSRLFSRFPSISEHRYALSSFLNSNNPFYVQFFCVEFCIWIRLKNWFDWNCFVKCLKIVLEMSKEKVEKSVNLCFYV